MIEAATRPLEWSPPKQAISRLPYLPGLDGMRALAVIAVMVYHGNNSWLPGGFLGVEVFFVISGYLITLLLIGEHERTGTISLRQFWLRRARRLLPALFTLLIGLTIYTVFFRQDALGQLRGDVLAGLTYVSNWYQIWVGQGYTAAGDFAPLRHLWSLAVEEQFYLLWPLVMVGLMRLGRRRLPEMSRWLVAGSLALTGLLALAYHPGELGPCEVTPDAYWHVGQRCLAKTDTIYLGTITRAGGLLLGGAFAMVWRPVALMRGPARTKGHVLDGVAVVGLVGLGALTWFLHLVTPEGADPWLFRGGLFVTGLATLAVMAAVTHRGAWAGPVLGNPVLLWIGTRSYGLYLYHWPIYQIIRRVAGNALTLPQFATAMAITVVISEVSYRFIEMPIRTGHIQRWWHRLQESRDPTSRRLIAAAGASCVALSMFAAANLAIAELKQNEIAESLPKAKALVDPLEGLESTTIAGSVDPAASTTATATTMGTSVPSTVAPTTTIPATSVVPTTSIGGVFIPATTTTTTPPTTLPPTTAANPNPIFAIGDSVMLGAAGRLAERGLAVTAEVSRQVKAGSDIVTNLRNSGKLGGAIVLHLGTNGNFRQESIDELMAQLVDMPRVVVLTIKADRSWVPPNNAILYALPARYPNVVLVDWATLGPQCPGDCFYDDGIHINQAGQDYYAGLIFAALGI